MVWDFSDRRRTNVLWVGQAAPADLELFLRRLKFCLLDSSHVNYLKDDGFLRGVAAVVFTQDENNSKCIAEDLQHYVKKLLDYDCLVIVLAASKASSTAADNLAIITDTLTRLKVPSLWPTAADQFASFDGDKSLKRNIPGAPKPPLVFVYRDSQSIDVIANLLVNHNQRPAPAMNDPISFKINGPGVKDFKSDHKLMLRRSFHDCCEIHISSLKGGQSGVSVYLAHVKKAGGHSLPFFVKIGPRSEIIREWLNYNDLVRPFIPFHLAPHLVSERCALGAHTGIIVGDFIEDAESLAKCAFSGRAVTPISSLFDHTLRGWHRKPELRSGTLYGVLKKLVSDDKNVFKTRYLNAKKCGAKHTLEELQAKLQKRPPEQQLWSCIHGDLHADNVHVRGDKAILIDFLAGKKEGLLLGDHAALEVSLSIRAPGADGSKSFAKDDWERVVKPLYTQGAFQKLPDFPDQTEPYSWLAVCIRQIRLYALPMQKNNGQYAHILAYYLLQAAIKDPMPIAADEDYRRAMAYCLAEKLILDTIPNQ